MRADYSRKTTNEEQYGVYCQCGVTIHLTEDDLTPPITTVECPRCKFRISYFCRGGLNKGEGK